MPEKYDIYSKAPKAPESTPGAVPAAPPAPPPHRRAIVVIIGMILLLAAVAVYFSIKMEEETAEVEGELDQLAGSPFSLTGRLFQSSAATSTTASAAIEALLTDLGAGKQVAPTNLSPQRMAEAMTFVRSAQQYIRDRDYDSAEAEIAKALGVWPDMNVAIRMLGSIYTQRGQFDKAIILLEKSLAKEPFSAETLSNLAINYMQKGMMGKAEELLVTALQVRPDYGVAYLNLAYVHMRLNRYDLAAENFELGLRSMPGSIGVLNNLAVCMIRLGNYSQARTHLQAIIDQAPNFAMAYFNYAITYAYENNVETAIEWIRRGSDKCTPSQLRQFLADTDFDTLRSRPEFQAIIAERFPEIPKRVN